MNNVQVTIKGKSPNEIKNFADKSADVVFYDPPYNAKKKYDGFEDNLTSGEYIHWMKEVWNECERVSKNGVIVYIGSKLVSLFQRYVVPENAHLIIVHLRAAGVFSGNYMLQYHAIFSTAKPVVKCKDLWDDVRLPGEGYFFREPRYDHPGLTGLELTKKVLHHFTKEGDTVLDPFLGTGTTAVACKIMDRNCVGVEQSQKYIDIALQRLQETE